MLLYQVTVQKINLHVIMENARVFLLSVMEILIVLINQMKMNFFAVSIHSGLRVVGKIL